MNQANFQQLEWDTRFFGKPVGRIGTNELITPPDKTDWPAQIIYYDQDTTYLNNWLWLLNHGFLPIQIKINLEKKLSDSTSTTIQNHCKRTDLFSQTNIENLSHQLAFTSRFYQDTKLERAQVYALYSEWFTRAIKGEKADYVFCLGEKAQIYGFVSYLKTEGITAKLDLLVIDADHRGRGAGKELMTQAERYLYHEGIKQVKVETQLANQALGFYESMGYRTTGSRFIFHRHRGK